MRDTGHETGSMQKQQRRHKPHNGERLSMEELKPVIQKLARVFHILKGLTARKFYGKVTISFEDGNPLNIQVTESFKVE